MPSSNELAVRCRQITKTYGSGGSEVPALRGVDLDVRVGELLLLMGPSGCGKTTLISVIAGLLDQDRGDCVVYGSDFKGMEEPGKTRRRGILVGFVFQTFNLIPTITAAENVAVPLLLTGASRAEARRRAVEILSLVGLGERTQSFPAELSGGQQQRVAIARALVHNPKLVVCDEPTSALDHHTGRDIMALMRRIGVGPGRAVVVVTHDMRLMEFADRVAQMDDGRITQVATGSEWERPEDPEKVGLPHDGWSIQA
jgi:putative ABC transport system ATP-binding protein